MQKMNSMRLDNGRPVFSATDLANFLDCEHVTTLDHRVARGELKRPHFPDPDLEMLIQRGKEHEKHYLEGRRKQTGGEVVEIAIAPPRDLPAWARAAEQTRAAMARGPSIIYQATFCDDGWIGQADFLVRVETPSQLGDWSYEVVDTKLTTVTKARSIIQLCVYSELLARLQGQLPEHMHIVLGQDAGEESFRVADYLAYVRSLRRRFLERFQPGAAATYPDPVEHCKVCDFRTICDGQWRQDDHLSLVAGISRRQRERLTEAGVHTLAALGALPLPVAPPAKIDIGKPALLRIREQARVQAQGRQEQRMVHELIRPVVPECGLASLPPPSPGDLYFDIEGEPFAVEGGIEYLLGVVEAPAAGAEPVFTPRWAFNVGDEKARFEAFIDFVIARLNRHPDLHVYHYAPYEPTALKRLMGRHGTREAEVDRLLREGILVDLYRAVRQGVRASVESYSIKKVEGLYGFARSVPLRSAIESRQKIAMYLAAGAADQTDPTTLKEIEGYNRDDCLSAYQLHRWLEQQRAELERLTGETLPRPARPEDKQAEARAKEDAELNSLKARLLHDVPSPPEQGTQEHKEEQKARWLLAQLLEWHRREDKSFWWDYFAHTRMIDEEHIEDSSSLGGLEYVGPAGTVKQSVLHRYRFPPQEHGLRVGKDVHDPRTKKSAGKVAAIDENAHTVDLVRSKKSQVPHPTSVFPYEYFDPAEQKKSLRRLGVWVADHGIDADGPYRAALDLLLRCRPRLAGKENDKDVPLGHHGEDPVAAACRLALALDRSVLPIQGPPGSGKTYTGARLIARLIAAGKKVGITANSHKVICNLLEKTMVAARDMGVAVTAIQRVNDEDEVCDEAGVTQATDNAEVLTALKAGANLVAGTSWLWSREDMAGAVDVLVVDEAGQVALANVLAVSPGAASLVLLGDPQQLNQPTKGVHPPGLADSALEHALDDTPVIARDRGLFIPETRRLHPDVCRFTSETFYEGKLRPLAGLEQQIVTSTGRLAGTGLRFIPVSHQGNQSDSLEEVDAIASLFAELTDGTVTWTDQQGKVHKVTRDDVLVVAPYNAQVAALMERLGPGARVGTVDKFQGQEAPVVICSMTTSTVEEAPRGMEFLYSRNRLNVATSRARCIAVVVANPTLLYPRCRSPRQIQLANAFCQFQATAS